MELHDPSNQQTSVVNVILLRCLTGLRDAKTVRNGPRHYLFHPIWPTGAPTGAHNYDLIELTHGGNPTGSMRFRIAEKLRPSRPATLEFKVTGMEAADTIEIALNGRVAPVSAIQREFAANGQSAQQGRALPSFYRYRIPVAEPLVRFGDNDFRVRLVNSAGQAKLTIQELELIVR